MKHNKTIFGSGIQEAFFNLAIPDAKEYTWTKKELYVADILLGGYAIWIIWALICATAFNGQIEEYPIIYILSTLAICSTIVIPLPWATMWYIALRLARRIKILKDET